MLCACGDDVAECVIASDEDRANRRFPGRVKLPEGEVLIRRAGSIGRLIAADPLNCATAPLVSYHARRC
jgi:hypothetical protein